ALVAYKYVGYLVAVLVLVLPPVVVAYGVTEAYGGLGFTADADVLWGFLAVTILGTAAYGALFLFISVLVRRPLAVGLLIGFVWESVVDSIPGDVPQLSVIHYLKTILKDVVAIGPLGGYSSDLSAGPAAGALLYQSLLPQNRQVILQDVPKQPLFPFLRSVRCDNKESHASTDLESHDES